jgi:hypothetical protein
VEHRCHEIYLILEGRQLIDRYFGYSVFALIISSSFIRAMGWLLSRSICTLSLQLANQRLQVETFHSASVCSLCGGAVKIIAGIEHPEIVKKILLHLDARSDAFANHLPKSRAPPHQLLLTNGSS